MSDEDLTAEGDDDSDLVKKLRAALKDQSKENRKDREAREAAEAKARDYERAKLFEDAGVPEAARGLLSKALADVEDLDVDKVRAEAEAAGLIAAPAPEAGPGEIEAHDDIFASAGDAPAPPTDLADAIARAETADEVIRLAATAGLEVPIS
jgi:hypothetical protein